MNSPKPCRQGHSIRDTFFSTEGRWRCRVCCQKYKTRYCKRRTRVLKAKGICIVIGCGKKRVNATHCDKHRTKANEGLRRRRLWKAQIGLCSYTGCKEIQRKGKIDCSYHANKANQRRREQRAKKRESQRMEFIGGRWRLIA